MRTFIVSAVCGVLLLGAVAPAVGQDIYGGIRGAVRDPDGGVLPGVAVSLINEGTQRTRSVVSNEVGEYVFAAIPAATFTLRAELPGFATFERQGIRVGVQQFSVLDINMQIAGVEETITVTGETPLIETANASMGSTLDETEIEVLPQPGRNAYYLAVTTPGVTSGADPQWQRQQDLTSTSLLSLGGGPMRGNNYTIDGASITNMDNRAIIIPNMNSVEEVKIQVSTYDAEMGRTGGGVFNTIHKSGTNNWGGAGMMQARPSWGRAGYFFDKLEGRPKPEGSYWLYGGAFGGPIIENKTFFWGSFEGYRTDSFRSGRVRFPSTAVASGDYSGTGITVYDPLTYDPVTGTRQPFPGNVIPADRIDPVSANLRADFMSMSPCAEGCDAAATARLEDMADQMSVNINHSFSDRWQMSGTFMYYASDEPTNQYYRDLLGVDQEPAWGETGSLVRDSKVMVVNSTVIPSDDSVLTVRFGWTRFNDDYFSEPYDPAELGFSQRWLDLIPDVDTYPGISITDYGIGGSTHGGWGRSDSMYYSQEVSGTMSKFIGSHTMKVGGMYRRLGDSGYNPDEMSFSFAKGMTEGPDPMQPAGGSGDAWATFLLGLSSGSFTVTTPEDLYIDYYAAYVQDDWRVAPNFVLNAGLRFERENGLKAKNNQMIVGWEREEPFPIQPPSSYVPPAGAPGFPLTGGALYAGVDGNQTMQGDMNMFKFGPRGGFAWTLNETTVVRGGVGLFWGPMRPGSYGQTGYSADNSMIYSLDGGLTPYSQGSGAPGSVSDPFPGVEAGFEQWNTPTGNSLRRLTNVGIDISMSDQFHKSPKVWQYSAELQKELPGNMALAIGYVGSKSSGLRIGGTGSSWRANQVNPQFLSLGSALDEYVPNPFYGMPEFGQMGLTETLRQNQLYRPYPQFDGVTLYSYTAGYSRYDSLQLQFRKRFRGRWGARVNYTYSRQYDNIWEGHYMMQDEPGTPIDSYDMDRWYGPSMSWNPHVLNLNGMFRVPGPENGGIAESLLGGWTVSATAKVNAGFPLAVTTSTNNTGLYNYRQLPNLTGADPNMPGPVHEKYDNFINPAAFEMPEKYTLGEAPRAIFDARGPHYQNVDLGIEKSTSVAGDANFQIRFEIINLFDDVGWQGPRARFGTRTFGQIQGQRGFPRTTQITLRMRW